MIGIIKDNMIRQVQAPQTAPTFCNNKCHLCEHRFRCYTIAEGIVLSVSLPEWYTITNVLEFKKMEK